MNDFILTIFIEISIKLFISHFIKFLKQFFFLKAACRGPCRFGGKCFLGLNLKKNRFSLIALTHNRRRRSFIPIPSFPKKRFFLIQKTYLTMHNCLDDQNAWKRTDSSLGFDPLTYLPGTFALISIHTRNAHAVRGNIGSKFSVRTERSAHQIKCFVLTEHSKMLPFCSWE